MGTHMPYGITQRYLPGDIPTFTPAKAGSQLSAKGCKAELA